VLTVRQVAERLHVSQGTVYGLIAQGRLRAFRIGTGRGTLRVSEEALADFLQAVETSGGQPADEGRPASRHGKLFRHLDAARLRAAWRDRGVG